MDSSGSELSSSELKSAGGWVGDTRLTGESLGCDDGSGASGLERSSSGPEGLSYEKESLFFLVCSRSSESLVTHS